MKTVVALACALVVLTSGCANFTQRVRSRSLKARSALAGSTLVCAGEAGRRADLLTVGAVAAGVGASAAAGLAGYGMTLNSTEPKAEQDVAPLVFGGAAVALYGVALVSSGAALVQRISADDYTAQAGRLLEGSAYDGGCEPAFGR